jgi:hypothetical protein
MSKVMRIDPKHANAYYYRAIIYYIKGEYDKAWDDIHKSQSLGYHISPTFLKNLSEASETQR